MAKSRLFHHVQYFQLALSIGEGELDQFAAAIEMKAKLLSEQDRQLVADFVQLLIKRD